jgi:hypothetical protein
MLFSTNLAALLEFYGDWHLGAIYEHKKEGRDGRISLPRASLTAGPATGLKAGWPAAGDQ